MDKYLENPLNEYEKDTVDFFLPALGRAYGVNVLIFQGDCEKCVILDDSVHTDNALHKKTLYFVRTLSLHVDPVVLLSSLPFVSSDADDSDVDIIEVIDKSVDKKKMLKLEKIDALKKIDPNPSFAIDLIVPLSSSPFVSSDADDPDAEIIKVIDKSVDNTKTLKLEKNGFVEGKRSEHVFRYGN